jgi:hypothetical protein
MTIHALIPLDGAGDNCGMCRHLDTQWYKCQAFRLSVPSAGRRLPQCLSAESEATRLLAIEAAARALCGIAGRLGSDHIDAIVALRAALKEVP